MKHAVIASAVCLGLLAATPVHADEAKVVDLIIKGHKFQPDRIEVEAGRAFYLVVKNQDPTPEEFESHDLHREKVIQGNSEAKIKIDALKPGEYQFVGEFNEATAKGVIVAK